MLQILTGSHRVPCAPQHHIKGTYRAREFASLLGHPPQRWEGDSELLLRSEIVREEERMKLVSVILGSSTFFT